MPLSDESKLLLANWDSYQTMRRAERKLRKEVQKSLLSLGSKLLASDWWGPQWHLTSDRTGHIDMWHDHWSNGRGPRVWIGVEGVTPESIFGNETPPKLYVLVPAGYDGLDIRLRDAFATRGTDGHGDIVKGEDGYVIRRAMPKCGPEEADTFEIVTLDAILDFFTHYAGCEGVISEVVNENVASEATAVSA